MAKKIGEFDWINKNYALRLKRGSRLKFVDDGAGKKYIGKKGTVAMADGQYIMILVDGDLKPSGPFHPTSGILYEDDIKSAEPDYPEHRKLEAVKDQSQVIGEFLEWVTTEKGWQFADYHKHGPECDGWDAKSENIVPEYEYNCTKSHKHDAIFCERLRVFGCDMPEKALYPTRHNVEKLLAEFFSIDLNKIAEEKDKMMEHIRAMNTA